MSKLNDNGTLTIEAYSFADFLTEFQEAVLNGFYLDLETNEYFPQKYGDHLFVVLRGENEVVAEKEPVVVKAVEAKVDPEENVETTPAAKPAGRPRKST